MEILDAIEQLGLSIIEPLRPGQRLAFGTVAIPAAIVGNALVATGIALFNMAAKSSGAALLDGAHGAQLPAAQRIGMLLTVGRSVPAKDVRHFEWQRGHPVAQRWRGGMAGGSNGGGWGSRSKGLMVAQMVLVDTLR